MIYIKQGSVFDEKCDLLILPCDSGGGVTSWVASEVSTYDLPTTGTRIPYGKVLFRDLGYKYQKADHLGYAASVDSKTITSSIDALNNIIKEFLAYCSEKNLSLVNLPVLGTGAGGLEHGAVIDLYRSLLTDVSITVNVFIPEASLARIFRGVSQSSITAMAAKYDNPRVFISYSQKSKETSSWAKSLADRLRRHGVNAIIDKYHLKHGMDLPQWMTNEIIKANRVILICDSSYAEKADTRCAGVGWETMIVQGDMLVQGESGKYVAIAYEDFDTSLPIYMKSKLAFSKADVDQNFEVLLEHLFDVNEPPEIGEIPPWIQEKLNGKVSKKSLERTRLRRATQL